MPFIQTNNEQIQINESDQFLGNYICNFNKMLPLTCTFAVVSIKA